MSLDEKFSRIREILYDAIKYLQNIHPASMMFIVAPSGISPDASFVVGSTLTVVNQCEKLAKFTLLVNKKNLKLFISFEFLLTK